MPHRHPLGHFRLSLAEDFRGNQFLDIAGGTQAAWGERGMTPQDCSDRIRRAPLGGEREVPIRQGAVLCVLTSFADAQVRGDEWRLARVEITGIGADGAVTVEVAAWNIPR